MHQIKLSLVVRNLLRGALAVLSAATLPSQEPPDAPPATISLEAPPAIVETFFNANGQAEVGLSGTTAYGLRLDSANTGTQTSLLCTADPVALKEGLWKRVTGACRILISAKAAAGATVRIVRIKVSRTPYSGSNESPPSATLARDVEIHIMPPPKTGDQRAGWSLASKLVVAAGSLLAILILAALFFYMRRGTGSAQTQDVNGGSEVDEISPVLPQAPGTDVSDDIRKRLRDFEEKLEADRKARNEQSNAVLNDAVRDLGRSAATLVNEARRLSSVVSERAQEFRQYALEANQLRKIPPKELSLLLAAVPETVLTEPMSRETATTIAAQFDSAVRTCVRDMPSLKGELEPMAKTLKRVGVPLDFLVDGAMKLQNRPLTDRLADVRGEVRNITDEVEAALAGAGSDRVCLYFRLELSTLSNTQQSLSTELANSLRKQLARLADPVGYFGMRFELTIGHALQEIVDCCDTILDPGRRIDAIQKQIGAFVAEADATLIDPRPGTPVLDNEHMVFGVVRCSGPGDKPDHISALRVRGIKRRGQVLRKASVTIFS